MTRTSHPHLCGFGCDFVAALGFLAIQYVAMPCYAMPEKWGKSGSANSANFVSILK
jgi:hypothetical protein